MSKEYLGTLEIIQQSVESTTPQDLSGIVDSKNPIDDALKLQALLEEMQKGKGCNNEMLEGMNVVVFSRNGHTS